MTFTRWALRVLIVIALASSASAATPAWMCNIFGSYFPGCGPAQPSFQPTFESGVVVQSPFTGATQPTADKVCALLGCTKVYVAAQCDIGGGPVTCSAPERICAFPTGDKNAGFLAAYWDRNPDNLYPGVALSLAKADMLK